MNFIPLHDAKIYNEKNESMATFEWLTMPHILITNLEKKIVVVDWFLFACYLHANKVLKFM